MRNWLLHIAKLVRSLGRTNGVRVAKGMDI